MRPAVLGAPVAQFAENGHQAGDLGGDVFFYRRQFHARGGGVAAVGHDADLFLQGGRQGHHHGIEAAAQGAGQFVDALVAVVGGGDHVEAPAGLHLAVQFGNG